MKPKSIFLFLVGLIILDLYFNAVPKVLHLGGIYWVLFALLFFPLAHYIAKMTGLKGLKDYGISFDRISWKLFAIGFSIGVSFWIFRYVCSMLLGEFSIEGLRSLDVIVILIVQIAVGYFLGSFLNDIVTKGIVFAHFHKKLPFVWLMVLSVSIYSIDDAWNEGFSLENTVFSLILGLSLCYVFFKTGSILASTGIHFGLNTAYGLFFGINGHTDGGIFILKDHGDVPLMEWIGLGIPLLMFVFVYLLFRNKNRWNINTGYASKHKNSM